MRRSFRIGWLAIAFVWLTVLPCEPAALACPSCKEAVSQSEGENESAGMSIGYSWSVLFMLTVPFSMMGAGAFAIHRAAKRGALPEL
jgi:hypothetical protein